LITEDTHSLDPQYAWMSKLSASEIQDTENRARLNINNTYFKLVGRELIPIFLTPICSLCALYYCNLLFGIYFSVCIILVGFSYMRTMYLDYSEQRSKLEFYANQLSLAKVARRSKCPSCGSHLLRRTATQGRYAGTDFLMCPNFYGCGYTEDL